MKRLVEISSAGMSVKRHRGFLRFEGERGYTEIPLDEISCLILNGYGASISQNALLACANALVPILVGGYNHLPASVIWPVSPHYEHGGRVQLQADASLPLKKRIWAQLVSAKIRAQALVLARLGNDNTRVMLLSQKVKSGDPENVEAEAARLYWPALFGKSFKRNAELKGTNSLLNYGYTVLRATIARACMGAGLTPSLGVYHRNKRNVFALCDDFIEPFRPMVDAKVKLLEATGVTALSAEVKADLVHLMESQIETSSGFVSVLKAAEMLAMDYVSALANRSRLSGLPDIGFAIQSMQSNS